VFLAGRFCAFANSLNWCREVSVYDATPVFIVGCGRSGTTLLRLNLIASRQFYIPPENTFIVDLAPRFEKTLYDDSIYREFVHGFFQIGKSSFWGFSGEELLSELCARRPKTYPDVCAVVYLLHLKAKGVSTRRWGDKNPDYVFYVDKLLQLFPGARFLYLIRDGRDVTLSFSGLRFGPRGAFHCGLHWRRIDAVYERWRRLFPSAVMRVQYEGLIERPEEVLRAVADFTGIEYSDQMLRPDEANRSMGSVSPHEIEGWHQMTLEPISRENSNKWRTRMGTRDRMLFEFVAGTVLRKYGYEVIFPALTTPPMRWFGDLAYGLYLLNLTLKRLLLKHTPNRG
jgi:hypothetical protein